MPVIRGRRAANVLTDDRRKALLRQLSLELAGKGTVPGPVIFEIPLAQSDKIDVLVVWDEWERVRSEDRSDLIRDAYDAEHRAAIAQPLGVTYQEAQEQQLLPYAVVPMARGGEGNPDHLHKAMLAEGGVLLPNGKVDLRFPTLALAEDAHHRLCEAVPKGYWSISQSVTPPL